MEAVTPPAEFTRTILLRELCLRHDRPGATTATGYLARGVPAAVFSALLDQLFSSQHFRFLAVSLLAQAGDAEAEEMFHLLAADLNIAPIIPAAPEDQPFADAPNCAEGRLVEAFELWARQVRPWAEDVSRHRTTRLTTWPPRRHTFRLKAPGWRNGLQFAYSVDVRNTVEGPVAYRVFKMQMYHPDVVEPQFVDFARQDLHTLYAPYLRAMFPLWEELPVAIKTLPPMCLRNEEAGHRLESWRTPILFETAVRLDATPAWTPSKG